MLLGLFAMAMFVLFAGTAGAGVVAAYFGLAADNRGTVRARGRLHRRAAAGGGRTAE